MPHPTLPGFVRFRRTPPSQSLRRLRMKHSTTFIFRNPSTFTRRLCTFSANFQRCLPETHTSTTLALKSLVFLSGGQTVYQIDDVRRHMWPDYINSLGTQQKATFLSTMFGGAGGIEARTVMVPVPLFSSAYYCRGGYQNPHGAWPAQSFRGQRVQIKIANTTEWVATGAGPTGFVEPPKIVVKEIYPPRRKFPPWPTSVLLSP